MSILKNPVQTFIRNFIRLIVLVPLWLLFALHFFVRGINGGASSQFVYGGIVTLIVLWLANIIAGMFGFKAEEFFEIEDAKEREVVKVDFS